MAEDNLDYVLALSLQDQFDTETNSSPRPQKIPSKVDTKSRYDLKSVVDSSWELTDPNPNIHDLFVQFDEMFFENTLVKRGVVVSWSNRMTLCAGVCSYEGRACFCSIRLSQPILKLRPRKDLVQTLLHEMIHAYLFVTNNNKDHDGHGPTFQFHMHRINELSGTKITIYHSFHDEVKQYRQHWWKCNGPCQSRPPFFGIVRRAMNRAPSPRDPWWAEHQRQCGGMYSKIREPEGYKKKGEGKDKGRILGIEGKDKGRVLGSEEKGKGRVLGGEEKGKGRILGGEEKGKGRILGSGNLKIDKIFSKKDKNDKTNKIEVVDISDVKNVSSAKDSNPSTSSKDSHRNIRDKMLAAAEKRRQISDNRSMLNHTDRLGKRRLSQTSNKSSALSGEYNSVPTKKPKLDWSLETTTNSGHAKPSTSREGISTPRQPFSRDLLMPPSQIINLCDDTPGRSSRPYLSFQGTLSKHDEPSSTGATNDGVVELIAIDDTPETEYKTCPVCGMENIPGVIINAHVSFCLDEGEEYMD